MSNTLQSGARLNGGRIISIHSINLPEAVTPDYSTLEVAEEFPGENESRFAEHHIQSPQLASYASRDGSNAPEVTPFNEKQAIEEIEEVLDNPRPDKPPGRRRCSMLMLAGIISAVTLAIAASVVGVLVGTHVLSTKQQLPGKASAVMMDGCGGDSTPPGLAAVSWVDSQSNASHIRVFFQNNNTNVIMQSEWDSDGDGWAVKPVTDASVDVKPNSPIAAAVSGNSSWFDIHVFYLGSNNTIYGSYLTDPYDDYIFDNLLMAEGLMADENSALASTWHDCDTCPGTVLLVFQDENQQVKLRNGTFTGTTTKVLPVKAVSGSSLTISALDDSDDAGLRLAFENETNDTVNDCAVASMLSVATWSDDPDIGIVSWAQENPSTGNSITTMASGSPIAAFTTADGTGVLGKLAGQWQVAQLEDFDPVRTVDMLPVPSLKGNTDIAQLAISRSGDLFLLSESNGSLAHWTSRGDPSQWHFVEQIQTML